MKKFFENLICRCGLHDWRSHDAIVRDENTEKQFVMIWWQCERCAKSKLKFISY